MSPSLSPARQPLCSLLFVGACLATGAASAGITPLGHHTTVSMAGDTRSERATVWHYELGLFGGPAAAGWIARADGARFSPGDLLLNGGSFTLHGFLGYVDDSCLSPTGWECTATAVESGVDLTWTYVGGKRVGTAQGLALGLFSAESMYRGAGTLAWSASGLPANGGQAAVTHVLPWMEAGAIVGPVGNLGQVVPEPSSLALGALALSLALGTSLRTKSQSRSANPPRG